MSRRTEREPLARRALRQQLAKQQRPPTLLEAAVMSAGVLRGAESLWSLLMWTCARRRNDGERPSAEDLAAMELVSVASAYKHQALLREVWGGDEGIGAMADVLEEAVPAVIGELVAVGGNQDRATAMVVVGSLPALGFAV